MIKRKIFLSTIILFLSQTPFLSYGKSYTKVSERSSASVDSVILKTTVKELRSRRGIRFFFMEDKSAPLVRLKIAFKNSGTAHQEKAKNGVPIFFAETVFQGVGKYSPAEFDKILTDLVSSIKCSADEDILTFSMSTPAIALEKTTELLNLALREPQFEEDKVKTIQESIIAELQNYVVNPIKAAKTQFIPAQIFKTHEYSNGLYGKAEDFAKLSVADLKAYREHFIVAKNAEVCVFGNIGEDKAIQLIDKIFEKIPNGTAAIDNIKDVNPEFSDKIEKYFVPGPQSTVLFALKFAKPSSQDKYAAQIASLILGNPPLFKTKIMGILRSKLGYIYGGRVIPIHMTHASYLLGVLQTDNAKVEKTIAAMKDIIRNLRENGITQSELDFAKGYITNGAMLVALRTSKNLCAFFFSEMQKGMGPNILNEQFEGIKKVTVNEVNKFCKENFDENNVPFIVMGGNEK